MLRYLLDARAAKMPDKTYAVHENGEEMTYAGLRREIRSMARALQDLGVRQGDHVMVWLPITFDCLRTWYALNYIGAVFVPLNVAYRGGILEHVIQNSDAKLAVVHADLVERLDDIDRGELRKVVVLSGTADPIDGLDLLGPEVLDSGGAEPLPLDREIEPWHTQSIIYTSGTTGPSKGVLSSYHQLFASCDALYWLGAEDRYLVSLPMFHVGGTMPCYTMLMRGGSISMMNGFSTSTFWPVINRTRTTCAIILGAMTSFLMKQPQTPDDTTVALKSCTVVPFDALGIEFGTRFGIDVYTLFHMTEISCPIMSELNPTRIGSAGKLRKGVTARIVDDHDCEVPTGEVGELILRTDAPWAMNHGYNKNDEATARAWRNGWFHTGDAFRVDEDGDYFFVDRKKDSIRRRGENISSFEVEVEISAYPGIREVAAVAVPSDTSEDEILVALTLEHGLNFDPADMIEFLRPRMPHFMVPRYIRVVDELPKTPTEKIRKNVIREAGVTQDAWDREAAGIQVKREKIA